MHSELARVIAGEMEAADSVQLVFAETGICESEFVEDGVPCCGNSNAEKPVERAPIEIPVVAPEKSGGCCGPRA